MKDFERKFTGKTISDERFYLLNGIVPEQPEPSGGKYDEKLADSHILFRAKFSYNGKGKVVLYYSADDYAKVYINGKRVSQGPAPCYPWHAYYIEKDITDSVERGENVIAFHTFYQGLVNRVWYSGDDRHGLIFDIECGGKIILCSDENVKVARHSGFMPAFVTGYDTQFMEITDSRATEVGFEKPSYDDSSWKNAKIKNEQFGRLYRQPTKELVFEKLIPEIIKSDEKNVTVYDFGREFVGNPVVTARGARGDKIKIFCGEELDESGNVRYEMRCNCRYEEEWILSGGEDKFEPFDYKAFRYAAIELPRGAKIISVYGEARHYPFKLKSDVKEPDDTKLKKVFRLCADTLEYGIQECYLDCPSREKGQYFGDGVWSALTHVRLTGDTEMYKKFVENAFQSAKTDEGITAQGPCAYYQTIAEFPLMVVISLKYYYALTGDEKFVAECKNDYNSLIKVYEKRYATESGLVCVNDRWNVVDWPQSARDDYDFPLPQHGEVKGLHNVMNAYYLIALKAYDELYGEENERTKKTAKAYLEAFYKSEENRFTDAEGSSHTAIASQIFGLLTETVKDERAEELAERMIREKRLDKSNLFVTPIIFLWLYKSGRYELLKELIKDENAWLNMIREGATTTFEAFGKDKKWNTSLLHTMFSFPALFLAGIKDKN